MDKGGETEDHIRALVHTLCRIKELHGKEIKSKLCEDQNGNKSQESTHEESLARDRHCIHHILETERGREMMMTGSNHERGGTCSVTDNLMT
jgi:hypothetical protein